jgi:hypothetical protein
MADLHQIISIFITSRVSGNKNHGLKELLKTLAKNTSESQYEVLVKFDDNDPDADDVIDTLSQFDLTIKHLKGPQGRGYEDIHEGYTSLIPLANPNSSIFICMADDFVVVPNWDVTLRKAFQKFSGEMCIVHQRPHPPSNRNSVGVFPHNPTFSNVPFADLYIIDEAPAWSADLIRMIGSFGPISFTDLWTLVIEKELYKNRIYITGFTESEIIYRKLHEEIDFVNTERWNGARKRNFDYAKSIDFEEQIKDNIKKIIEYYNERPIKRLASLYSYFRVLFGCFIYNFWCHIFKMTYEKDPKLIDVLGDKNIVKLGYVFYCVPQSLGSFDLVEVGPEKRNLLVSSRNKIILRLKMKFKNSYNLNEK